jgi:hypothetical protein
MRQIFSVFNGLMLLEKTRALARVSVGSMMDTAISGHQRIIH